MGRIIGVDLGTMFFQVAEFGNDKKKINVKTTRNAFVELDTTDDVEEILSRNNWQYIKDQDKYYVIGEDSLRVANMFPGKIELRRPMQDGVLNANEPKKTLILSSMVEQAIGKAQSKEDLVCTCVSSESVDESQDNVFHKNRLIGIFKKLGYQCKVIEEGLAVILSSNPVMIEVDGTEAKFTGIGISSGAGRMNCVLAYKALQVVGLSCARSGDYIDRMVAAATGYPVSQITRKKETKLDFTKIDPDDDVLFALDAYYSNVIEYVFKKFALKFKEVKSQFEAPLDIILAGGTAMPKGFCAKVEEVVRGLELPFEIKEVKLVSDPRSAVVKGCLRQAYITAKQHEKQEEGGSEDAEFFEGQ